MRSLQTPQLFEPAGVIPRPLRYLLFLPAGYSRAGADRWPLLLFLHGAGERGSILSKVAKHGPPRIVQERPDFPFIVVSPQCPAAQCWPVDLLNTLLDDLVARLRVDPGRVYLTGLSMGGYAAWEWALRQPERFAAAVPICGGGSILPILLAEANAVRALKTLGIWAFHGAKDPVVPVRESERMVQALREAGNAAKLTIYPEAEHDSWTETYDNPALYKWLLSHSRVRRRGRTS